MATRNPSKTHTLLAVATTGPEWGVDAGRVERVLAPSDWQGDAPLDVAALLGYPPLAEAPERVLLVRSEIGELPLAARGSLRLREFSSGELLELPALMWREANQPRWIAGVLFPDDDCPLLLLDTDVIAAFAARREQALASHTLSSRTEEA